MWHLDGTPGSAVTLLHAGPWGVPGHRSGLPWLPGRGHCDQHTACSRMAGPRGLPAPPGLLASPRGVGRQAGQGGRALWRRKLWGLGWSPSIATHWDDLGQTSLLPPSPSRIRTPGGGCVRPNEGRRPSPLQHGVSGWQRLLLCSCLLSHPSSCASGRTTPTPPPPPHGQGSPSQPHQQSPAPPCPG